MSKTIGEFLHNAAQAATSLNMLHCPKCWEYTNHRIHTRGYWEYHTCEKCGNVQYFKVR